MKGAFLPCGNGCQVSYHEKPGVKLGTHFLLNSTRSVNDPTSSLNGWAAGTAGATSHALFCFLVLTHLCGVAVAVAAAAD